MKRRDDLSLKMTDNVCFVISRSLRHRLVLVRHDGNGGGPRDAQVTRETDVPAHIRAMGLR
jgi:hypothetical protein